MNTDTPPAIYANAPAKAGYIAMQDNLTIIRLAQEACQNELDNRPHVRSLELENVVVPDGHTAVMRCSRSKKGVLTVSIRFADAKTEETR